MIKDSYINSKQSIEILEKFILVDCQFDKLEQIFKFRRSLRQLQKFIKQRIKTMILQLETNLCRADWIKQMKIYDNSSDRLFCELTKMNLYLNKQQMWEFLEEQKYKITRKKQSIPSKKRKQIYDSIISYAYKNQLFSYSVRKIEILPSDKRPYECPEKLYSPTQLELINLLYQIFVGDYAMIQSKLQDKNYDSQNFKPPLLYQNLSNLQLIGLYRCYVKSISDRGGIGMNWGQFISDDSQFSQKIRHFDPNLLVLLVRIAIKGIHQVSNMQIKLICNQIGRKFDDKPIIYGKIEYTQIWKNMGITQGKRNQSVQINNLRQSLNNIVSQKIDYRSINPQT